MDGSMDGWVGWWHMIPSLALKMHDGDPVILIPVFVQASLID